MNSSSISFWPATELNTSCPDKLQCGDTGIQVGEKKGSEYLLDQYINNKSKAGGFFSLLLRYRGMFFIGQIHDMNHSSLLDHSVMNVPGRSGTDPNSE